MMSNFTLFRAVNFKEMPSLKSELNFTESSNQLSQLVSEKPIIRNEKDDLNTYCKYLLLNIKKMGIEDVETFINKLFIQTIHPIAWLNNIEKLINLNLFILAEKVTSAFLSSLHLFIEEKRSELEYSLGHVDGMNIRRSNGSYSFKKLKYHLNKIDCSCEKKHFLIKCKIEYQQFKPRYIAVGVTPFNEKIDLEIQRITTEEEFHKAKKSHQNQSVIPVIQKIKVNSQINQFADIFYQMINEYKINDQPLIETSNANIAKLIATFFTDTNGISIEQSTIETYLQKNKPEKRPKEYNRIKLT